MNDIKQQQDVLALHKQEILRGQELYKDRELILSAQDIEVEFTMRGDVLKAIRSCSMDLYKGETLAIVGESGSGKSVFTKCFVGMLDHNGSITNGQIMFEGRDLTKIKDEKEWYGIRGGKIGMVMQDPMTSLNPLKTIGKQIEEAVVIHQGLRGAEAKAQTLKMLELVGIPEPERRYKQYPHEFSGGMRQRVVIAIAAACRPQILICDEPTTALDVTIQAQILELIRDLQKQLGMTIIYITHDLGVVANVADRVCVMYAGQIIESGTVEEIFYDARHPYSWALLGALPQLGTKGEMLPTIDGTPPNLFTEVIGDAFAPRNRTALKIDSLAEPPFFQLSPTHKVKTWLEDERAPHVLRPAYVENLSDIISNKMYTQPKDTNIVVSHEGYEGMEDYSNREVLMEVKDLQVSFGSKRKPFVAVNNVNFKIYRGETLALVGESGSGKTTIGRALLRINPISKGEILFKGKRIDGKIPKELDLEVIKSCQMIFQDPMASLNERAKVDYIVSEGILNHKMYKDEEDRKAKVAKALLEVGLLPEFASRFPHEFSGGQRQRIGIARALIMNPEFIVADEPISALDVSIQAQVINLMNTLKKEYQLTYLFIAHDLSVVRFISDRIAVIHLGEIVEMAETEELFRHPIHPYTRSLISAVPVPDPSIEKSKELFVYDRTMHNYKSDRPGWHEILPGHFIRANQEELEDYKKNLVFVD